MGHPVMTLAARYTGGMSLGIAEVEPVEPGAGQVRIAVAYTGICGTDLHILHGAMDARVTLPAVLGHEMSGRISAIGDGVTDWKVGDPVTVMPLIWCGTCASCRAGHTHVCENLVFVGIDSPGSMQQSWTVPQEILVRIPDTLDLKHAALVEPVAVAVHDVGRAALVSGEYAVVIGGGPVGLLIACVVRDLGAEVIVVEVDAFRRSVAEAAGLRAIDPTTVDLTAEVLSWTAGAGAAVAFEVSGSQPGLDTAIDVLAVRGRMIVVGIHPEPRPISLHRVFWRELTIIGARVYRRADFDRAVELVANGVVPADLLITGVRPLPEAERAFAALEPGGNTMKVLIDCESSRTDNLA